MVEGPGSSTATMGCCCENDRLFSSVTPGERGGGVVVAVMVVAMTKAMGFIFAGLRCIGKVVNGQ